MALLGSGAVAASDILTAAVLSDLEAVARDELPPVAPAPAGGAALPETAAERLRLARTDLSAARAGLARVALSSALGTSTAARDDVDVNLSEGDVLDVAEDYSAPRVGEGLARFDPVLGEEWPDARGALWLGGSGKALAVDTAFRTAPQARLAELAGTLRAAVDAQDERAIDQLLDSMR
jgi:hypothetical protein